MMVSEVPQIDLSSLSRQQLQHLLETSRRAGRTGMADAVAHEMRERRAQPETHRSWVEVDFSELAAEPDLEVAPELRFEFEPAPASEPQPEPEPEPVIVVEAAEDLAPRRDLASAGPADPYTFSAIRSVPDGSLRVSAPAPRRTGARARTPLPRTSARVARPPGRRGLMLGAVALGAAAVAAVVALVPLQQLRTLPGAAPAPAAPVVQAAALAAPPVAQPETPAAEPPPRAAVALTLRGPISDPAKPTAATPATPAPPPTLSREFTIAAADLRAAADQANQIDMAKARADGLQGTWISPDFAPASCRWSRTDPTLAVCRTRTRYEASRPWRERVGHYRRDAGGVWQVAP